MKKHVLWYVLAAVVVIGIFGKAALTTDAIPPLEVDVMYTDGIVAVLTETNAQHVITPADAALLMDDYWFESDCETAAESGDEAFFALWREKIYLGRTAADFYNDSVGYQKIGIKPGDVFYPGDYFFTEDQRDRLSGCDFKFTFFNTAVVEDSFVVGWQDLMTGEVVGLLTGDHIYCEDDGIYEIPIPETPGDGNAWKVFEVVDASELCDDEMDVYYLYFLAPVTVADEAAVASIPDCTLIADGGTTTLIAPNGKTVWTITEEKESVTANLTDWGSVPAGLVENWMASKKAVAMTYEYNHYSVAIRIPEGKMIDAGVKWYGPKFLVSLYSEYAEIVDQAGRPVSVEDYLK